MTALHAQLDAPLPAALAVGAGSAVFVAGWCVPEAGRVVDLAFDVDGREAPVTAFGMPRLEVLRALGRDAAYRSGFWGLVALDRTPVRLGLRARLDDGSIAAAALGTIGAEALPEPVAGRAQVAICMATFRPPMDLLRRQLASIREQTHRDWVCVISDDHSDPATFAALREAVGDDRRFVVSRSERRLGFYRNFERALALAPRDAAYVALADQDDAWRPHKLERLLGALGDARLAYSDARLVDPSGRVLAGSYWTVRRNNHRDLRSLLAANAVTGAASLFRRELLDVALPFPPAQFAHFHDHWIALVALALGDIAYVDEPLYDYTQHGDAVLGHAAATRVVGTRERLASLRANPRDRVRVYRGVYFADVARLSQMATILLARAGDRMAPRKRRVLEGFLAADGSLRRAGGLWLRGAREYAGRQETMGAERGLAYALLWRRALAASARDRPTRLRLDAQPPATLAPQPGRRGADPVLQVVADKVAPLALAVRDGAPPRVNVLLPTIDLAHLFAGYIGKLNLARRLAERGHRVRIVTVDPVGPLPSSWRAQVEAYEGLGGLFERVEVAFGREAPGGLEVSRDDRFVATTWWTAHVAAAASRELGGGRFLYLIQEYEPFTFPHGTWSALAERSYALPHAALFSTELLRDWFRGRGIGVYANGPEAGDAASAAFQNAISAVAPRAPLRPGRRLLFYARPEPHAARNLFELGALALARAHAAGALAGWELRGIGAVGLGRRLDLGDGASLELLPRTRQADYAALLAGHDVGLALMHTPHPSLVPIEMAAAGLIAVTSTYANKTAEALAAISPNILAAEPTVESVAAALARAVELSGDAERRVTGADVRWARDWETAFSDAILARAEALLSADGR